MGWIILVLFTLNAYANEIDFEALNKALQKDGLELRMHAAVPAYNLYVATWRSSKDFFTFADFPIKPANETVAKSLRALARHDKVRIKGKIIENDAPIR